jgi:integrase
MWDELIDGFVESERSRGLRERSLEDLRRQLGVFAAHVGDDSLLPEEVTAGYLRDFCVRRAAPYGYATAKAVVWSVKGLFGWLKLNRYSEENPSAPLRYPRLLPRRHLPQYLKAEQLRTVLTLSQAADTQSDFALLSLLCSTGLRTGDVAGLTRENLDLDGRRLAGPVKGGWLKTTVLSESLAGVLRQYLQSRPDSGPALFLTAGGKPAGAAHIRKVAARAGMRAELPLVLTCQMLRHTFATHAAERHGRTITQALLGHRRGEVTAVYTHLSAARFRPLMNRHPYNDAEVTP